MRTVVRVAELVAPATSWMRLLGVGVDGRRGVVEHEHLRVGEGGAGEGDALALAARQREAALADDRVVAVAAARG